MVFAKYITIYVLWCILRIPMAPITILPPLGWGAGEKKEFCFFVVSGSYERVGLEEEKGERNKKEKESPEKKKKKKLENPSSFCEK